MSAYKKIECDIVDKDTLLEALKLLGFSPDVLNEPKNLTGYRGDERKEIAHIIIPRDQVNKFTGASNDIGFLWNEENQKYDFICSEYVAAALRNRPEYKGKGVLVNSPYSIDPQMLFQDREIFCPWTEHIQ